MKGGPWWGGGGGDCPPHTQMSLSAHIRGGNCPPQFEMNPSACIRGGNCPPYTEMNLSAHIRGGKCPPHIEMNMSEHIRGGNCPPHTEVNLSACIRGGNCPPQAEIYKAKEWRAKSDRESFYCVKLAEQTIVNTTAPWPPSKGKKSTWGGGWGGPIGYSPIPDPLFSATIANINSFTLTIVPEEYSPIAAHRSDSK